MGELMNRADAKWGHPEAVEEGWYDITMMSYADMLKMPAEALKESGKTLNEALKEGHKNNNSEAFQNTKWQEFYTEKNCIEDPDGPSIRILVGMPEDIRPDEKLPLFFSFSAGILVTDCSIAEIGIDMIRPYIYEGTKRFVQISYDTPRCIPAYKYPASINDAHAAYQWVIDHAEELHIDTDRIVWTGISSGGHAALCTAFRMKRYNWGGAPMPRGIVPIVPVMDDIASNYTQQVVFDREDGSKAAWDSEQNHICMQAWLGDLYENPSLSPEAVPARASLDDVKGFPPVWVPFDGEFDPSADSMISFTSLLRKAGVFADVHLWGANSHQGLQCSSTDFGKRVKQIIIGALRDAVTFDFRRL